MTVRDLIDELSDYPDDAIVVIEKTEEPGLYEDVYIDGYNQKRNEVILY